jgi:hypothetical protein
MGTDIHGVFQRHNPATNVWEDVESKYEQGRHYQLFAVLADVRNGTGFAGVRTGEPVNPISNPRGYPADFTLVDNDDHPIVTLNHMDPRRRKYHEADEPMTIWMGDHSHSWLSGKEMLAWFKDAPKVIKTGLLERPVYEKWDKVSEPESYCGNAWGANVIIVNNNAIEMAATPNWMMVRCEWEMSLAEELRYFFDEVKRLTDEHGQIRFVFGFDS